MKAPRLRTSDRKRLAQLLKFSRAIMRSIRPGPDRCGQVRHPSVNRKIINAVAKIDRRGAIFRETGKDVRICINEGDEPSANVEGACSDKKIPPPDEC